MFGVQMVPEENAQSADALDSDGLSDADRIAIDFLLDRRDGTEEAAPHSMAAGDGSFADRVEYFGSVLKLLADIVVPEPSPDLLTRLHIALDSQPTAAITTPVFRSIEAPVAEDTVAGEA